MMPTTRKPTTARFERRPNPLIVGTPTLVFLVIDTVNFTPSINLTGNYDGNLHLVEKFTRVDRETLCTRQRLTIRRRSCGRG